MRKSKEKMQLYLIVLLPISKLTIPFQIIHCTIFLGNY